MLELADTHSLDEFKAAWQTQHSTAEGEASGLFGRGTDPLCFLLAVTVGCLLQGLGPLFGRICQRARFVSMLCQRGVAGMG